MPYSKCIRSESNERLTVEHVQDDKEFAQIVAAALRQHPAQPPMDKPTWSTALQGNLCEFSVWDIGERFWCLYDRHLTWTTNASSPWRSSSDPGIDVLALSAVEDQVLVWIIEVKSTSGGGSGTVDGKTDSLKVDFRHLFEGDVQARLLNRIGEVVSDLIFKYGDRELAQKVTDAVGTSPENSSGVFLVGTLVCRAGNRRSRSARSSAFERLVEWLIGKQKWNSSQIACRCIEVQDFSQWLDNVIEEAVNGSP